MDRQLENTLPIHDKHSITSAHWIYITCIACLTFKLQIATGIT